MVFAKPIWFKKNNTEVFRILTYPWQSVVYTLLIFSLSLFVIFSEGLITKLITIILLYFLFIDGLLAYQKSLDERQIINHAIVYRNAFLATFLTFTILQAINYNLNPNYHFLGNMTYFTALSTNLPPAITYNLNLENIFILTILPIIVGCLMAILTYYQLDKRPESNIFYKIANNNDMLIAKSKWFKRKNKSDYWILDISWKGAAYILVLLLLILFVGSGDIRIVLLSVLLLIIMAMNYLIAYQKSLDERQRINHAIAERNAFWGILIVFIIIQAILFNYNLNLKDIYLLIPLPLIIGFLTAFVTYYKLQGELLFL